jgi:hypothetical protein
MKIPNKTEDDFRKFWSHLPWESRDETAIVLKGHLLVEDLLREFCASRVRTPSELPKAKLTFQQVVHLSKALMNFHGPTWVWGGCNKLNSLRNDLAHKLTPPDYLDTRKQLIDFIIFEAKPSEEFLATMTQDHQRLGVAIFLLYSALSVHLNYRAPGLAGLFGP